MVVGLLVFVFVFVFVFVSVFVFVISFVFVYESSAAAVLALGKVKLVRRRRVQQKSDKNGVTDTLLQPFPRLLGFVFPNICICISCTCQHTNTKVMASVQNCYASPRPVFLSSHKNHIFQGVPI